MRHMLFLRLTICFSDTVFAHKHVYCRCCLRQGLFSYRNPLLNIVVSGSLCGKRKLFLTTLENCILWGNDSIVNGWYVSLRLRTVLSSADLVSEHGNISCFWGRKKPIVKSVYHSYTLLINHLILSLQVAVYVGNSIQYGICPGVTLWFCHWKL